MTAKEWLSRARRMERRLRALRESKQRAYDRAVSSTAATGSDFTGSGGNSSPGGKNDAYAALSAEVDSQIKRLEGIRTDILHVIDEVDDNRLSTVLTEYYINDKSWEEVAAQQHYSWRWTMKLHSQALSAVEAILEKRT